MDLKSESIKIRVTKEEKERLKELSLLNNENLSSYLLKKGMEDHENIYRSIPDKTDICDLLNEIYHEILTRFGSQIGRDAGEVFQAALSKYGNGGFEK